jgi:hypothetical protein
MTIINPSMGAALDVLQTGLTWRPENLTPSAVPFWRTVKSPSGDFSLDLACSSAQRRNSLRRAISSDHGGRDIGRAAQWLEAAGPRPRATATATAAVPCHILGARARPTHRLVGRDRGRDYCCDDGRVGQNLVGGDALALRFLRVRPGILFGSCEPYNSAQHEPDHRQSDKSKMAAREVLVVFREAAAAAKPAVGTLDYPAFG